MDNDNDEIFANAVILNKKSYCAGGPTLPMARFWNRGTHLTVHVIFVHTLTCILPRRDVGTELEDSIRELKRRLDFFVADYRLSLGPGEDVPTAFIIQLCRYICFMFYKATIVGEQMIWPVANFVEFGIRCLSGNARASDLTAEQFWLLRAALVMSRSLFFCGLEAPFSLVEDFKRAIGGTENLDPTAVAALQRCKLQVPGYCWKQRGWGQNYDVVSVVLGCNVPLLLRPVSTPGELPLKMRVVNEAYVEGIMNGEMLGNLPVNTVTLV